MVVRLAEGYDPKEDIIKFADKIKSPIHVPKGNPSFSELYPIARDIIESYCKKMKDGLAMYRPICKTAERFHASIARTRAISGGNQSGKTSAAVVEVARMWRGMDPYGKRNDKPCDDKGKCNPSITLQNFLRIRPCNSDQCET